MMKHAKLYNSVNDIARYSAQELINKFGKTIQEGWNCNTQILDVGCGDGSVTKIMTNNFPQAQWSACDISSDMIQLAKQSYSESGVDFFHMDIRNEINEELRARFDCVFCLLVLHRIPNHRKMMKHAKLYNSANHMMRINAQELLKRYGESIQEGWNRNTKILDVGCGDGSVTEILINSLPQAQWSACDISTDMIRFAEQTYGGSIVDFFHMDIRNEVNEALKARFDCVFCLLVLQRIYDQRLAFSNIYSLIKPNGRCVVSIMSDNGMYNIDRRMANIPKWSSYITDVNQLISPYHGIENQEECLKKVMEESGFHDVSVTSKKFVWPYNDTAKYRNLIKSVDPCLSEIPLELHEEYVDDYFKILADDGEKSPPYYYRLSVLEAIGYK